MEGKLIFLKIFFKENFIYPKSVIWIYNVAKGWKTRLEISSNSWLQS